MNLRDRFEKETGSKVDECPYEWTQWLEALCTKQADEIDMWEGEVWQGEEIIGELRAERDALQQRIKYAEVKWAVIDSLGSYKLFSERVMAYACSEDGDTLIKVALVEVEGL
jgi:hypothetical protein